MQVKVIASSQKLYEADDIKEVYAPGEDGELGILPGHINLITTLQIGELKLTKTDGEKDLLILNGGLMQVENDHILILADEAALESNLVKEEIEAAIARAEQQMSSDLDPAELIQLEKRLRYEKFKRDRLAGL